MPRPLRQEVPLSDVGSINLVILAAALSVAALMIWPRIARAELWRAAITPLASIIGSGFLVIGPILNTSYGPLAPLVMLALCLGSAALGGAIRFNIARIGDGCRGRSRPEEVIERFASWALTFAYLISVAYYLNLFGAFAARRLPVDIPQTARLLTSAVYLMILMVGWRYGFRALERMEAVSVGLKLAVIGGLLAGLAFVFFDRPPEPASLAPARLIGGWPAVGLAFGLIVTVQGFETSRYLTRDYPPSIRIRSMRLAQLVSTVIYMIYILLLTSLFPSSAVPLSETAIIDMMAMVAPILPAMLVLAALSAQFSAAVADTSGAGGLLAELTRDRISPRVGYGLLVGGGLLLTWSANVFELISYASRAFALYYALQCAIAAVGARDHGGSLVKPAGFGILMILALAMAIFGTSVEA